MVMQVVNFKSAKEKKSRYEEIDESFANMAKQTYLDSILNIRKMILNAKTENDLGLAKMEVNALQRDIDRVLLGGDGLSRSADCNPHFNSLIIFITQLKNIFQMNLSSLSINHNYKLH